MVGPISARGREFEFTPCKERRSPQNFKTMAAPEEIVEIGGAIKLKQSNID